LKIFIKFFQKRALVNCLEEFLMDDVNSKILKSNFSKPTYESIWILRPFKVRYLKVENGLKKYGAGTGFGVYHSGSPESSFRLREPSRVFTSEMSAIFVALI
jgi:hypothetical protein